MDYISIDLDKQRKESAKFQPSNLFAHQQEALSALKNVFDFKDKKAKAGLMVMPTGGGKTLTAVKWIYDEVISRNIKVIWLAHTFHLLDQAYMTFYKHCHEITPNRKFLNIRIVSSNPTHSQSCDIRNQDDIIIMTTPSAISNYAINSIDLTGKTNLTYFRKFLEHFKDERILLVLDEAHHAPAYGCRKLITDIKSLNSQLYLLGLTATPTYADKSRRGWLHEIFANGIISEAKKNKLQIQNILARENYIQKQTNFEQEVDDRLYKRLVIEHKDIPEDIINILARDEERNNTIVNDYVDNKNLYGKTIIFADRWFQCVYLKQKLLELGIKEVDSVYSHIDADPDSVEARNKRGPTENQKIIEKFRANELKVLINVRMLTEGTDIPDTKTVFITRNTTSQTLFTQMIGRALRGVEAGGGKDKKEANIVLFNDTWKRLISWATPELEGGISETKPFCEKRPLEIISISLIEKLSKEFNSCSMCSSEPFEVVFPIGWYETEYSVDVSENNNEELNTSNNIILVYNSTIEYFQNFIQKVENNIKEEWKKEKIEDDWLKAESDKLIEKYFKGVENYGDTLTVDIINIMRHIGQYGCQSLKFISFDDRDKYNIDKIAEEIIKNKLCDEDKYPYQLSLFNKPGTIWKDLYQTFHQFQFAIQCSINRINDLKYHKLPSNTKIDLQKPSIISPYRKRELTEKEKEDVKKRDGNRCLSCGVVLGRGVRLEVDHILPNKLGGMTTIENSQTLCQHCNKTKLINEIDYTRHTSSLSVPKPQFERIPPASFDKLDKNEGLMQALKRSINYFYHCSSVVDIKLHTRSNGEYYTKWLIELYTGNNPKWLLKNKGEVLNYIHDELDCKQVKDVIIK